MHQGKEEKREATSLFLPLPKHFARVKLPFHIPLRESCENKSVATGYESAADKLSISRAREASQARSRAIERRSLSQIR